MEFKTFKEAKNHFVKYTELTEKDVEKNIEYVSDVNNKPKMGEWILFKHIRYDYETTGISPPILGLCLGHNVWDLALVLEYATEWRAWEVNSEILNTNVNYYYPIANSDKEVQHIQFWTDNIIILGHWKQKPTFSQLRCAIKEYELSPVEYA